MTSDVGTTERKPLTPRQRLKLFEAHKGICAICHAPIRAGDRWIDEHLRALGLGGTNEWDNRAPVHKACADLKTQTEDMPRIVKAKRAKMAALGIKSENRRIIQSPRFPSSGKKRTPVSEKFAHLPRSRLYEDAK